ncbi:kinase-like domain-containing protein [Copromyces sp. CBS 386.78]|nr:kinase-like domain-containing protein [Copromyces sp. CBS 386.78]
MYHIVDQMNGSMWAFQPMSFVVNSCVAVQIAEPETPPVEEHHVKKQFSAGVAKRLGGRPAPTSSPSRTSLASITSQAGIDNSGSPTLLTTSPAPMDESPANGLQGRHRNKADRLSERLVAQVAEWIRHEKTKRETRKTIKVLRRRKTPPIHVNGEPTVSSPTRHRSNSISSDSSEVSLDRLQKILDDGMSALGLDQAPQPGPRIGRRRSRRSLKAPLARTLSSDTEFFDGDVIVPSCDVFLDNSKTMSYSGGQAATEDTPSQTSRREEKEKQAWLTFKNEIIRLAHTLRLKGWRRIPLNGGETISVERLSGALTNAVYVVSPPPESVLPPQEGKRQPEKVLLRVYGPQVEHLIDREIELGVLKRLARKKIGPRLLGTFLNGRFEQYFNSTTLTPGNLREPETSRQIAKRMRELHAGVDLLEHEKDDGPAVWRNWDRWLDQAEKTAMYLDNQVAAELQKTTRHKEAWKTRGFVCGVEWPVFKQMVQKYRKFLEDYYGSPTKIREKLVFAHNDTQYGNILRIRPDDKKSPLLQPANEHKQLVVIDFEYAGANLPGLEFANHFSEWTYNYHDPVMPHICDTTKYPTLEQQRRFIKAYVDHQPKFPSGPGASTPTATHSGTSTPTPGMLQSTNSTSSIVDFMLDARVPPGGWREEDARREAESEKRIKELLEETRLWRVANSAQWIVWGIIQAKIPGLTNEANDVVTAPNGSVPDEELEAEEEADSFDYLGYSQERAFFFWADCVRLGLVTEEELPENVRSRLKFVEQS